MNRVISAIVCIILSAIGLSSGNYFEANGVIPVGDMRIPAAPVGGLGVIIAAILGAIFGKSVPWSTWIGKLQEGLNSDDDQIDGIVREPDVSAPRASDDIVPPTVHQVSDSIYRLRILLKDNAACQKMLDSISTSAHRKLANIDEDAPAKVPSHSATGE